MNQCDICEEMGCKDCMHCELGNPCLNCNDYDERTDKCASNGGCGDWRDVEDDILIDLRKARQFLDFEIEALEGEQP